MLDRIHALVDAGESRLAQRLGKLPARAQVALSLSRTISLDGQTLAPDVQLALSLRKRLNAPALSALSPAQARARMIRDSRLHSGPRVEVHAMRDLELRGSIRARHYATKSSDAPLVVFFHGGGFVVGNLETHDALCRRLCALADSHVLAIDYRLAPEHPFPAAIDDCWAALRGAFEHARALGADPSRIAVAGDSAGGNLSAVMAQLARDAGLPLALQCLIYPAVDRTRPYRSLELFADGFLLTRADVDWYQAQYASNCDLADPRITPALGKLEGLAPALVFTAGFDPLRDEGEAYAAALKNATLVRFSGLVHGFTQMCGPTPSSLAAVNQIAQTLGARLHHVNAARGAA